MSEERQPICGGVCEGESKACGTVVGGFMCSRAQLHDGPHIACGTTNHDITGVLADQAAIHEPDEHRVYCVRCGGGWPCESQEQILRAAFIHPHVTPTVQDGDTVERGDVIGTVGGSGPDRDRLPIIEAAERFTKPNDVTRMTVLLMKAWGENNANSDVSQYPTTFVATFVDMARAALSASQQHADCRNCGHRSDCATHDGETSGSCDCRVDRDKLAEAFAEYLGTEVYWCHRDYSAWAHGTMSLDDFKLARDDDGVIDSLIQIALEALPVIDEAKLAKAVRDALPYEVQSWGANEKPEWRFRGTEDADAHVAAIVPAVIASLTEPSSLRIGTYRQVREADMDCPHMPSGEIRRRGECQRCAVESGWGAAVAKSWDDALDSCNDCSDPSPNPYREGDAS